MKQEAEKCHFEQGPSHKKVSQDFSGKDPGASLSVFLTQEGSCFLKNIQVKNLAQIHVYASARGRPGHGAALAK